MSTSSRILVLLAAVVLCLPGSSDGADVEKLMGSYINALTDGDYEKAGQFWHPQYLETCNRLGIEYRDVDYKYDCISPLLENIDLISLGKASWKLTSTKLDPEHYKVILKIETPDNSITYEYFFLEDSDGAFLIPRFWLHLNNLSMVTTRYFDIFYHSETQLNDFALFDLDQYVETVAASIGVGEDKLKLLEAQRMEYFYAESENEVAELLGFPSRGTYYIPSDIIISKYLPDYHEIARFMINFTQDSLGLYVEPFIARGLASMLGGRFGQSRDVMPQIANFTLKNDLYSFEDVLTFDSFHNKIGNIDFSFPLSLGLVEAISSSFNITTVLALIRDLSGTAAEVASWTPDDVKAKLTARTGKDWEDIERLSEIKVSADPFPNLKPGIVSDTGQIVFQSGVTTFRIKVVLDQGWYNVMISSFVDDPMDALLVLEGSVGHNYTRYKSFLWEEQANDYPYSREIYAIRFSDSEVGIYDYLTNQLIAKYVAGFDDSNKLRTGREMSFHFKEDLLRSRMDQYLAKVARLGTER